jgi:hypothetical protein
MSFTLPTLLGSRKLYLLYRYIKHCLQWWWRGWSDRETWDLTVPLGNHISPRIRRFIEINIATPPDMRPEEWDDILDKIASGFEFFATRDDLELDLSEIEYANRFDEAQKGINLFAKYYNDLWW